MTINCAHCGRPLTSSPEFDAGDWILRCLHCGACNIIAVAVQLLGWR